MAKKKQYSGIVRFDRSWGGTGHWRRCTEIYEHVDDRHSPRYCYGMPLSRLEGLGKRLRPGMKLRVVVEVLGT